MSVRPSVTTFSMTPLRIVFLSLTLENELKLIKSKLKYLKTFENNKYSVTKKNKKETPFCKGSPFII